MTRKEGLVPKISNGSFRYLMENDGYYVDKTSVIKTLFAKEAEQIQLIARPRRFGKSLTLSMLYSFFTCVIDGKEVKGDTSLHRKLFSGLKITGDEDYCREHMGQYPVIYLNFKDICTETFRQTYCKLCDLIRNAAKQFSFVLNGERLDDVQRITFKRLIDSDYLDHNQGKLENALKDLTDILNSAFQKKVIILIDEYDVPLQKSNVFGYYDKMVIIIRNMLSAALKDEGNNQEQKLFRAILTGCFRASKESIFTGLNNLSVDTVVSSSEDLAAAIGFTDEEVTEMLDYFGLGDAREEVRRQFDGYRIEEREIYCAWSVTSFCWDNYRKTKRQFSVYWINTSGNDVINDFLGYLTPDDADRMEILLNGGTVDIPVNETMSYQELKNHKSNDFWSLLLYTGYLTSVSKKAGGDSVCLTPVICTLKIPNREILSCFKTRIQEYFSPANPEYQAQSLNLVKYLVNGDADRLEIAIEQGLEKYISVRDISRGASRECYYHAFLNGYFCGLGKSAGISRYQSNPEAGNGYADIVMVAQNKTIGIIIELKCTDSEDYRVMSKASAAAIGQIDANKYQSVLSEGKIRRIYSYGITFCKKSCCVRVKSENVRIPDI